MVYYLLLGLLRVLLTTAAHLSCDIKHGLVDRLTETYQTPAPISIYAYTYGAQHLRKKRLSLNYTPCVTHTT